MIVATAQCLNGVAVIHFPVCSVPLLRHRGRLCQPNKALVSNTKRHCCWSIVTCSASYHIESDGVTVFWSTVQLLSPRGIMGVNLPHTVLLQARESIIISRNRWRGFSAVFLSLLSDYTAGIWFDTMRVDGSNSRAQTMNDEIHMKSDESYSTHIRRQSDSSFICEVMIVEICLSIACVHRFVFFCFRGKEASCKRVSLIISLKA